VTAQTGFAMGTLLYPLPISQPASLCRLPIHVEIKYPETGTEHPPQNGQRRRSWIQIAGSNKRTLNNDSNHRHLGANTAASRDRKRRR